MNRFSNFLSWNSWNNAGATRSYTTTEFCCVWPTTERRQAPGLRSHAFHSCVRSRGEHKGLDPPSVCLLAPSLKVKLPLFAFVQTPPPTDCSSSSPPHRGRSCFSCSRVGLCSEAPVCLEATARVDSARRELRLNLDKDVFGKKKILVSPMREKRWIYWRRCSTSAGPVVAPLLLCGSSFKTVEEEQRKLQELKISGGEQRKEKRVWINELIFRLV